MSLNPEDSSLLEEISAYSDDHLALGRKDPAVVPFFDMLDRLLKKKQRIPDKLHRISIT